MKIVVSNTTPIRYLIEIGAQEILASLYGHVTIPSAVFDELTHSNAPQYVRDFILARPDWLVVRSVKGELEKSLIDLDRGEQEAISLALEINADLVLLDEAKGRRTAKDMGLQLLGTLGVLEYSGKISLIDLPEAVKKLRETSFRVSSTLIDKLLKRYEQNKGT